jgi:hypothetical protein
MRYIVVPPSVAKELGLEAPLRRQIATGEYILNETDLSGVGKKASLETRVKNMGGRIITLKEARKLLKS